MDTREKEIIDFVEIANELNGEMFEKYDDIEVQFYYMTNGYYDVFGFGDKMLWNSDNDNRNFIEEINDYEPFKPFIINVFNSYINKLQNYRLII